MDPKETAGAIIDLSEAKKLIKNFITKNPDEVKAYLVDSSLIKKVLEQDGCVRIRIYNGFDNETNQHNRVIVGVNEKNEDMAEGIILERFYQCPPHAAANSLLAD